MKYMQPSPFIAPHHTRYLAHYNQSGRGSNLDVFRGDFSQSGYGLGSLIAGLARRAVPFLSHVVKPLAKKALKSAGREGLKIGSEVLSDVISGESPKQAMRKQGKRQLDRLEEKLFEIATKKPRTQAKVIPRKAPKKKLRKAKVARNKDIFSN